MTDAASVPSRAYAISSYHPAEAPDFIRTAGYTSPGDHGAALYRKVFSSSMPAAAQITITLSDNATTATYEIAEATITWQQVGAAGDGVTDDADAIVAAAGVGVPMEPVGTFLCTKRLDFTGRVIIRGFRKDKSKIIWSAAASSYGIKITPSSWADYVEVRDMGLWTRGTSGTALQVDCSGLPSVGIPYFDPRIIIDGNDIRGETVSTQGFLIGVQLDFQFGARVSNNYIQGIYSAGFLLEDSFPSSYGIYVPDQSTRVLANLHVRGNIIFGFKQAVAIYNVEGVWFQDNDVQVCFSSLLCVNTISRLNQYRISGNHLGSSNIQIRMVKCRQVLVIGNEISYRFGRADGGACPQIMLDSVFSGSVTGNSIRGNVPNAADIVILGILLLDNTGELNTQQIAIVGNEFQNLQYGIVNRSTSSANLWSANTFINMFAARVLNEGGSGAVQTLFMGPGAQLVPVGQNPALCSSGLGNAAAFFNRDTTDGAVVAFTRGNVLVGSIGVTASGASYNTTSDKTLKENIGEIPLENVLAIIDVIRFHEFTWKVTGQTDYGVFAQDLYAIYPQAVTRGGWIDVDGAATTEGDANAVAYIPWAVDYSKLIPVFGRVVQGLVSQHEDFERRITALEARAGVRPSPETDPAQ